MNYKYCIVPNCSNTSFKTPEKLFFCVPKNPIIRKEWCSIIKRDNRIPLSVQASRHCCEDHFDVEEDMENYIKFKLVGGQLKLKKGVVPHKFTSQEPTKSKEMYLRSQVAAKSQAKARDRNSRVHKTRVASDSVTRGCTERQRRAGRNARRRVCRGASRADMLVRRGALGAEKTASLIKHVKSYTCLWNFDHEEENPRAKIASAWADIAERMELPEDLIRAKWKNLRDTFVREVKKLNLTRVEDYRGTWRHFRNMWFLYRVISGERASSDDDREAVNVFDVNHEAYVKIEIQEPSEGEVNVLNSENEALTERTELPIEKDDSDTSQAKRRRLSYSEDCDVMFLTSLAPYFKLLKPIRKLVVRNKIQETILKEIERSATNGH